MYHEADQNKFEVLGEAKEMDQRWEKFKVAITEAAMEQRLRQEIKIEVDD